MIRKHLRKLSGLGLLLCTMAATTQAAVGDAAKPPKDAAVKASAVSGFALTTHRSGGDDDGFAVAPATFGEIVRHDIKDNRVVGRRVIYPGKARAAVIDPSGERVAFIKLDGRLHVMKADGTGLEELAKTRNRNASAVAWPAGDWVYYSEEGKAPQGRVSEEEKADTPQKRSIRRINVVSGEDEEVGAAPEKIWQLSLALTSGKGDGRYAISNYLADLSQPGKAVNARPLRCGTMVSPSGQYVTEVMESHADLSIWTWDLGTRLTDLRINAFAGAEGDGRRTFYRPRWSANSDKWLVMTHGMDYGCTTRTNVALYNWKEQIQIQLTQNPLDGQACDEGEAFWLAGLPVDFSVTELEGKAPYTIELKSPKVAGAGWKWDFGDGATGTGAVGRHTYTQPGDYIVTAREGQSVLRQRVLVLPPKGPVAKTASVLDPRHVLVEFEEPVTIEGAAVKLVSGQTATKLHLQPLGRGFVAEFEQPLATQETLVLEKVTDRAQVPNAVANPRLPVRRPSWPADATGLVYLWENAKAENQLWDPIRCGMRETGMRSFSNYQLSVPARFNRFGAAVVAGGGFELNPDAPEQVFAGIQKTQQFSFEIVVEPADLAQTKGTDDKPIAIAAWGYGWGSGIFWLIQEKDKLLVGLSKTWGDNKPEVFEMATLPDTKPHHVVVSIADKRLAFYLDGKKVKEIDPSPASFLMVGGSPFQLAVHGPDPHKNQWRGKFEYLAMYNRFIEEPEAAKNAAAVAATLAKRKALPQIELQAKLVAKSQIPAPAQMAPYRNALVVNEYQVEKVLKGTYTPKTIRVAQWGVSDLKPTPVAALEPGASVKLVLETFADHGELASELVSDTLEEDFKLNLYTDVNID